MDAQLLDAFICSLRHLPLWPPTRRLWPTIVQLARKSFGRDVVTLLRLSQLGSAGKQRPCQNERSAEEIGSSTAVAWRRLLRGLPLCGGAQLAIDTALVSTLHCGGSARAARMDGAPRCGERHLRHKEWGMARALVCYPVAHGSSHFGQTAFGQNQIWPTEFTFGQLFSVTAFEQTAFWQNWCFSVWAWFGQMCS